MRLHRLELRQFRRFGHIELEFEPDLTVVAAVNGEGKTTVLDGAAIALGPFVGAFSMGKARQIVRSDARISPPMDTPELSSSLETPADSDEALGFDEFREYTDRYRETYGEPEYSTHYPVTVRAEMQDRRIEWERELRGPKGRTTTGGARILAEYATELQKKAAEGQIITFPIVAYYSASRLWVKHRDSSKRVQVEMERSAGYEDCLSDASSFVQMSKWIENATLFAIQRRKETRGLAVEERLAGISYAVHHVLQTMGFGDFKFSLAHKSLTLTHDDHGELPLERVSDGIRAVATMTADIAFRATKLNPHLGGRASEQTPGIVLIDELDLHLHPRWQQEILGTLRRAFPLVQFIVSTHSPQVLATVPPSKIRVISRDESTPRREGRWLAETPRSGAYGRTSSVALANIMGVAPIPTIHGLTERLHEFEALVVAGDEETSRARRLRESLENEGYEFDDGELTLWRIRAKRRQKVHND